MHEMGIASSVLEALHEELHRHPGYRPAKVGLRIGEYAGVDRESLKFCLDTLVKDTPFEPLELVIEPGGVDDMEIAYFEFEETPQVKS